MGKKLTKIAKIHKVKIGLRGDDSMKKGINEYGIPKGLSRAEEFAWVSAAGFDGIELNLENPLSPTEVAEILQLCKKHHLEIIGLVSPHLWQFRLTSNDSGKRKRAQEIVKQLIIDAKALQASCILLVPGMVDEETSYIEAYENSLQAIRELKPFIQHYGVSVGIENVWNKFLLSPLEMRHFIEEIDSPLVGAYFDVGNAVVNSYPEYWIEILNDMLFRIHLKDFKRSVGNLEGFVDLLEGDVNWPRVMSALRSASYDGYLTVEVPFSKLAPQHFLNNTISHLETIFSM